MNMSSSLWQAIHGTYGLDSLVPAKDSLTAKQLETAELFGIPVDEIYHVTEPTLNPLIWFKEGVSFQINWDPMYLKMFHVAEAIRQRSRAVDDLKKSGDYLSWFSLMEKQFIIPMMVKMHREIPREKLYDVFISVWTRAETGFEYYTEDVLRYVFETRAFSKEWKSRMREFNKKVKDKLEDGKLLVFHGEQNGDYNPGDMCSWTLSRKVAEFFAYRFSNHEYGSVEERHITPADALDYLTDRAEEEVLLWPEEWAPLEQNKK